jgi:16S rRNA processing protein RimM
MTESTASPVVVAKIAKTHGIKGEVVLESWTDVEGRIENTPAFLLMDGDRIEKELTVESRRFFRDRHVIKFKEISTLTDAEKIRGKLLAIPEEELGELPPDHFFIHDLIGMRVQTKDGKVVGQVKDILKTGGVDLLEVGEQRILIPFTAEICIEVSPENQNIIIDPPEGLLQLNAR